MMFNRFEAKRHVLSHLLEQCTERQQRFFDVLWGSVNEIPIESLDRAIDQCERAVLKNNESHRLPIGVVDMQSVMDQSGTFTDGSLYDTTDAS